MFRIPQVEQWKTSQRGSMAAWDWKGLGNQLHKNWSVKLHERNQLSRSYFNRYIMRHASENMEMLWVDGTSHKERYNIEHKKKKYSHHYHLLQFHA